MKEFIKDPTEHWEDWWAWYPVYIHDRERKGWLRVWRDPVQRIRRVNQYDAWWEYRLPPSVRG